MSLTAVSEQPQHPKEFNIPSLDGIRAVSIGLVFVAHAGLGNLVPGGFGVTVFFFLSGYLICTLLRREHARHGQISLKNFYLRRVFRIFPPMYAVLLLGSVFTLAGGFPEHLTWEATLAQALHVTNLFYMHGGTGMVPGLGVYWSLAIEEHFYFIFPVCLPFVLRLRNARNQALLLSSICLLILVWRVILIYGLGADHHRTYYGTDTRFDSILWGCVLALFHNPVLDVGPQPVKPLVRYTLLGAGVVALLGSLLFRDEAFRESFRYTIQSVALLPIFYFAVSCSEQWPFRWLNLPWVRYIGRLSYPFYLVHFTVQLAFELHAKAYGPVVIGALSLVVSTGLAMALHHWLELPVARYRRQLKI
jgi:peptidoglycan/LPS O-acetylase OafA/YrhL